MQQAWSDNGVAYLGAPIGIDDYLLMTKFPVESLDDLDGKKIAAPGAAINCCPAPARSASRAT